MAKSAPKHFFSKLASVNYGRSQFDMSHTNTTTIKTDYLYPVFCQKVIPGDSWNISVDCMCRMLAPIDTPMMDNLYMDYHFWYVQDLLVWKHLKQFFGEPDRNDPKGTEYSIPKINIQTKDLGTLSGSIYDYFKIPIQDENLTKGFKINALPLRAYNLIYDDWYRDEQRIDLSYFNNGDEETDSQEYKLLRRGKRFDYMTSTLLEPQIGEMVSLPLGNTAPVVGNGYGLGFTDGLEGTTLGSFVVSTNTNGITHQYTSDIPGILGTSTADIGRQTLGGNSTTTSYVSGVPTAEMLGNNLEYSGLVADLSQATASNIADLRYAFQLQAYNEVRARNGERYTEYLYGIYGVVSPDARLYRPEYLGGCHTRLTVQPVLQNSETANTPQGNLTGIVYGGMSEHGFTRSFTEHGFIIGIVNIYSDLTYYQGLDRIWSVDSPLDYPIPMFANLTDQPVYRKEILLTGDEEKDNEVFGYAERYAEYKYVSNSLTGLVRPNAPLSVGYWTLAQTFDSTLSNNKEFIESNTPIDRITAVEGQDSFILNQEFKGNVVRCLPTYSDPMKWFMRG